MTTRFSSLIIACIILVSACDNSDHPGFKKTETGLHYQFIRQVDPELPTIGTGDRITLNLTYSTIDDSIIYSTSTSGTPAIMKAGEPAYAGDIMEGIRMMREGDSAIFITDARMWYLRSAKVKVPDFIKEGDGIKFMIGVTLVQDSISLAQAAYRASKERERELEAIRGEEYERIKLFLSGKGWGDRPNISGLIYVEHKTGSGAKPDTGDLVTIHYTGTLLDGTKFNSTYDHDQPLQFKIGDGKAIAGLDRGIQQMRRGGRSTLVIPSGLAFGAKGVNGTPITEFASLVFEVQLLKVE
jgi:FKBP-type peptidyl-prolyl cis-trans isomerase